MMARERVAKTSLDRQAVESRLIEYRDHLKGRCLLENPLIRKLSNVADLSDKQRDVLQSLCDYAEVVPADEDILRQGDRPDHLHLVLEGWAMRYHILPNGSRQISAYLLPGDFCDMHVMVLQQMDHSIATLTPSTIAFVPIEKIRELAQQLPELTQAMWWATLVDEGVMRAWIVNLGRRSAFKRAGHLICELYERMKSVGLVMNEEFALPLTQAEIADSLGLTPVHINRVIQRLRQENLIVFDRQHITIPNIARLKAISGFDPSYLHPEHVRLG
jgi:CRP-like cAMP-binding protein